MRSLAAFLTIALFGIVFAAEDKAPCLRLTKENIGKLPSGWKAEKTGKGEGSVWKIVADDSAPSKSKLVLAQAAASPAKLFNLCVADDGRYRDVEAQVAFKAVRGKEDQGGGIVWRYQDADNYYVARMNPLESNYRVYKVVAGKRSQLETKGDLKVRAGEWHVLKIRQVGEHIECWLDGTKYLDAKDKTFSQAGKIGLWTKADAQTYFDDFRVADVAGQTNRIDCKYFSIDVPKGFKLVKKSPVEDFYVITISKDDRVYVGVYVGNNPSYPSIEKTEDTQIEESKLGDVEIISQWKGDKLLHKEMKIKLANKENWPQFLHVFFGDVTKDEVMVAEKIVSSLKLKAANGRP